MLGFLATLDGGVRKLSISGGEANRIQLACFLVELQRLIDVARIVFSVSLLHETLRLHADLRIELRHRFFH